MVRFLLLLPLIWFVCNANGQTRSETELWLKSTLNEYNQAELYGTRVRTGSAENFKQIGSVFDRYSFQGTKLLHEQIMYMQDGLDSDVIYYIDLSKIIKIRIYEPDHSLGYNGSFNNPLLTVEFQFNDPKWLIPSLDKLRNQRDSASDFESGFYQINFYKDDILNNNLPKRIKRAFEHLAVLEGATLVKDIF